MKPPAFTYYAPTSVAETLDLLAEFSRDGKILAGGQSFVPLLNMRLAEPHHVIDINRVSELEDIRTNGDGLTIGALVRQQTLLDPTIAERCPLLAEAAGYIGHRTIRNRGTVGGSLAHADPSAELPAVMVALGAEVTVTGRNGDRVIPAADFFVDYLTTALQPDELLTSIRLPSLGARTGWSFQEVSRRHGDYALVGVAALVRLDESGVCTDARVVMTGVGPTPHVGDVASTLVGQQPTDEVMQTAARAATAGLRPDADVHASAE